MRYLVFLLLLACSTTPDSAYRRADWGGWTDPDRDCQDTRQEVLLAESKSPVRFKTSAECSIASGRWEDFYSGEVLTDPALIDIDHVVSVKEAYDGGGSTWSKRRRSTFYNDRLNLVVTSRHTNRSKGDAGPKDWTPPDPSRCRQYMARRAEVLSKYGLKPDQTRCGE